MTNQISSNEIIPEFLQFLKNELDYSVFKASSVLGFDVFYVDFSSWKLMFSNRSPVIWVQSNDYKEMGARELAQALTDVIRNGNYLNQNPILLVDEIADDLQKQLKSLYMSFLVLDKNDQIAIMKSRRPTGEMLDRFSRQLDISAFAPYATTRPVTGSRFFGRDVELNRILHDENTNYAILGIRRIGKTSLLQEIQRRLIEDSNAQNSNRIIYLDCSDLNTAQDFVRELVRRLNPRELLRLEMQVFRFYIPSFLERMSQMYKGKIILLLDEFDGLLKALQTDSSIFNALRASSNTGYCRYVFAGFRELYSASHNMSSPLFNFAQVIYLHEFTRQQTRDMVIIPLESLRVKFEQADEIVSRIYEETGGYPNHIQYYCRLLVEKLERERSRVVTLNTLPDVYDNEEYRSFVLASFTGNTTNLEKAIVYSIMVNNKTASSFDMEELDLILRKLNITLSLQSLDQALANLKFVGILVQKGKHYSFTSKVFPQMLVRSYDVEYLLRKIIDEKTL